MADWTKPTLTSNYSDFVAEVKGRDDDLAKQFDGTTSPNVPTGTIKWNSSNRRHEKWNGSAWSELVPKATAAYSIRVEVADNAANADALGGQSPSYYTNIPARLGYTPYSSGGGVLSGPLRASPNGHNASPAGTNFSHTLAAATGSNRVVNFDGNGYDTPSVWWTNGGRALGAIDAQNSGLTFWANNGSTWQQQVDMGFGYFSVLTALRQGENQVLHAGNWSSYASPIWYQGWVNAPGWDANSLPGSRSGFTYANNAPHTGTIVHFESDGYGLQLNGSYIDATGRLSFRSRQGDQGVWQSWRELLHSGNFTEHALSKSGNASTSGGLRSTANWGGGLHNEQITARGTYPSMALRSTTGAADVWLFHNNSSGEVQIYHAADGNPDSNSWTKKFALTNAGQFWTSNYGWLHDYFFNSVGNCIREGFGAGNAGNCSPGETGVINCYGSGNIFGYQRELVDNGGQISVRSVRYYYNCNCNCACDCY